MSAALDQRVVGEAARRSSRPPSPASDPEEVTFLGVPIAMIDDVAAAQRIADRPPGLPMVYVVTPNAANFTRLNEVRDPRMIEVYRHAWMRLIDGQIPRALAKALFGLSIPLATGSDITLNLLEKHIAPDDPVTVIGGSDEMVARLKQRFGLKRVFLHDPPQGFIDMPEEIDRCVDFILAHPSRYIFLTAGSPQSEYVALRALERGGAVGCALCVGSALNFATGLVRRAPRFMRRAGLEWAYRLMINPFGHWRRIFIDSMPVLWTAARARLDPAAFGMETARKDRE